MQGFRKLSLGGGGKTPTPAANSSALVLSPAWNMHTVSVITRQGHSVILVESDRDRTCYNPMGTERPGCSVATKLNVLLTASAGDEVTAAY